MGSYVPSIYIDVSRLLAAVKESGILESSISSEGLPLLVVACKISDEGAVNLASADSMDSQTESFEFSQ